MSKEQWENNAREFRTSWLLSVVGIRFALPTIMESPAYRQAETRPICNMRKARMSRASSNPTRSKSIGQSMEMKESLLAECSPGSTQERRRKPRRKTEGLVFLTATASGASSLVVSASLVNLSESRFCASHSSKELSPGREVAFCHDIEIGVAKVVWTEVLGQETKSGFLILEDSAR